MRCGPGAPPLGAGDLVSRSFSLLSFAMRMMAVAVGGDREAVCTKSIAWHWSHSILRGQENFGNIFLVQYLRSSERIHPAEKRVACLPSLAVPWLSLFFRDKF